MYHLHVSTWTRHVHVDAPLGIPFLKWPLLGRSRPTHLTLPLLCLDFSLCRVVRVKNSWDASWTKIRRIIAGTKTYLFFITKILQNITKYIKNIYINIKNIKLHIVTDIKVSKENLGWQGQVNGSCYSWETPRRRFRKHKPTMVNKYLIILGIKSIVRGKKGESKGYLEIERD